MASLIQGYNYDIFISYRQKDNKHDGWVTEFVNNLKGELESTFKEEISVYFDINPHDGLLETHDVDASLKEKLKCLIFIPIISRTYCDPKSFAWEHEFKAFIEMASKDQFGLKVKVPGGNVSSRVLPIQIHDLATEDKKTIEEQLGGHIRGIEFIYKEPGVDRPLKPEDKEEKNLCSTKYNNQINKVANAIRGIVSGLKNTNRASERSDIKTPIESHGLKKNRLIYILGSVFLLILIIGGILFSFNRKLHITPERSIAVIPLINDSPDKVGTDYIVNGILDEIINNLQQIKSFSKVLPRSSVEKYRSSIKSASEMAKELNVNYIINGSAQMVGDNLILTIRLIEAKKDNVLMTYPYNGKIETAEQISSIYTKVAQSVASELKIVITPEEKEQINKPLTNNITALDYYRLGKAEEINYTYDPDNPALKRAGESYMKALIYDSTFAAAYTGLARVNFYKNYNREYYSKNFLDSFLILINKALSLDNRLAEAYFLKGLYYFQNGEPESVLRELDNCLKYNPNYWQAYYRKCSWLYGVNSKDGDYVKALENIDNAINLNQGNELFDLIVYRGLILKNAGFNDLGLICIEKALTKEKDSLEYFSELASFWEFEDPVKAKQYAFKCLSIRAEYMPAIRILGGLAIRNGNSAEALEYYGRYANWMMETNRLENGIMHRIGYTYFVNGNKKEADYWFRKQKQYDITAIQNRRFYGSVWLGSQYDLAGVYAFEGKKDSALINLRKLEEMKVFPSWWLNCMKTDPLLLNLREDKEYKDLLKRLESKYQAEHDRVGSWLKENKML